MHESPTVYTQLAHLDAVATPLALLSLPVLHPTLAILLPTRLLLSGRKHRNGDGSGHSEHSGTTALAPPRNG